jgi:hypothetical protein
MAEAHAALSRAGRSESLRIEQVTAERGTPPILKRYLERVAVARPRFDVTTCSPRADLIAEAPQHSGFRLRPQAPANRKELP